MEPGISIAPIKCRLLAGVMAVSLGLGAAANAFASTNEPAGINLGSTTFNVGFGRPTPGWIYEQYLQDYSYDAINDSEGKKIGRPVFNNQSVNAVVSLNQVIYLSPLRLLGGNVGFTALVSITGVSAHNDKPAYVNSQANGVGVGDIVFGTALQYPPVFRNGRPVFVQRYEIDVIAPTGSSNAGKDVNQSDGFWSINPYYSFTVLPIRNVEFSAQLFYLHNFQHGNPGSSTRLAPGGSYEAGDAVWANFAGGYSFTPQFQLGFNGYAFQQITQDRDAGVTAGKSLTENIALGPGAFYAVTEQNFLFAGAYLPLVEKNTLDGFHLLFRYVHFF